MAEAIRILLVEDNNGDARLVEEAMKEVSFAQFHLQRVVRLSEAFTRLKEDNFQIVILDLSLPDSQGLETFTRMRKEFPEMPIIVLTGFDDETQAFEAFGQGAQTYLMKGRINSYLLTQSIQYAIQKKKIMKELDSID